MLIKDIYVLKESDSFVIKEREELTINLELVRVPPYFHTLLVGMVFCNYCPIRNATVLVHDKDGNQRYRTTTDEYGIYRFRNIIAPGSYNVIVSAAGYNTSFMKTVYVYEYNTSYLTFRMVQSSIYTNGVVFGDILECGTCLPIDDAIVYLKSMRYDNETIYKTRSNYDAHYLIYDVLPDYYKIVVEKQGYQVTYPIVLWIGKYERKNCNFLIYRQ